MSQSTTDLTYTGDRPMWIQAHGNVAFSYVSMAWERKDGDVFQRLDVLVWNDGTMDLVVQQTWKQHTKTCSLKSVPRRHIRTQDQISEAFHEAMHRGE